MPEIWRISSFPQNLAWIHAKVSEKPELTDGCLRHDSSSADKVKHNDMKYNLIWKTCKHFYPDHPQE